MFLSFLTIIGIRTMFSVVMFFNQQWVHCKIWINGISDKRHFCALFHHLSVVNRIVWAGSPRKWSMILDQNCRSVVWINLADIENLIHNHIACFQFVCTLNLFLGQYLEYPYQPEQKQWRMWSGCEPHPEC